MDTIDKKLLNLMQNEIPIDKRPFKLLGKKLSLTENEVLERLFKLKSDGFIRRIGGIFDSKKLGYKNTLLGIDAAYNGKIIGTDLNEEKIIKLLKKYPKAKLILSPIGAQGFVLGRGNLQLSPNVIKKIGIDNIIVISTPSKLANTPIIRVDTGDKKLDQMFVKKEFCMVVIGYRLSRVVKIQIN